MLFLELARQRDFEFAGTFVDAPQLGFIHVNVDRRLDLSYPSRCCAMHVDSRLAVFFPPSSVARHDSRLVRNRLKPDEQKLEDPPP